ncbi:hypothetical protein NH8B_2089 [Pseudogulbenkiania sp. NH8B]|uniref:hypothetical protein n=1 Tax=Pseudogulbenkiania sp. (strain NH8B) TaxID=748280 RepID=UPI0002279B46|nr:hypothetical protein [Pseudogulbenkiania sp. NH8B]BAK76475.1 hypothetical protein NH8B_1658 [Pseudogulbenkiania sp. NH8B]BAK76904.1 hypothetical protein NH8B_2089 [Pseudogulbenkiania sp. NH8B]
MTTEGVRINAQGDLLGELDVTSTRLAAQINQIAPLGGNAECAKEAAKRLAEALFWVERATGEFDGSI